MHIIPNAETRAALHRQLFVWLFGDVAFAIIPVVLIAIIKLLMGGRFGDFFLLKEWSFATIVLFGVAIRRLIRLKIDIQLTPTSYKLDTGVQSLIMLIIAAAVVLALVSLEEMGGLHGIDYNMLGLAQMLLFTAAVRSTWKAVSAEEHWREGAAKLKDSRRAIWLLGYAANQLDAIYDRISNVQWAFHAINGLNVAQLSDKEEIAPSHRKHCVELDSRMKSILKEVTDIHTQLPAINIL